MSRVILKGFLKNVSNPEISKKRKTQFRRILISIPPKTDDFGEIIIQESVYEVLVFGNRQDLISHLPEGQKIELTCYLNSKPSISEKYNGYNLSLNLITTQVF